MVSRRAAIGTTGSALVGVLVVVAAVGLLVLASQLGSSSIPGRSPSVTVVTYTYGGTFDGGDCRITTTCFAPEGTVTTTEPLPLTSQQSQSTSQSPPRTYLLTALSAVVIALVALAGSLAMARRRRSKEGQASDTIQERPPAKPPGARREAFPKAACLRDVIQNLLRRSDFDTPSHGQFTFHLRRS